MPPTRCQLLPYAIHIAPLNISKSFSIDTQFVTFYTPDLKAERKTDIGFILTSVTPLKCITMDIRI